jgi:6-phosphogluconolactonase
VRVVSKIVSALNAGITACGTANFVVSGGSSPVNIFSALVAGDYDGNIDWSLVTITLVDDRLVSKDHADSNQKLIHEKLLQGSISAAQFLPLTSDGPVANLSNRFDVMMLGMGLDGHFASLFPSMINDAALDLDAEPSIITTRPMGNPHLPRISMNLSMIIKARFILLLAQGEDKKKVLAASKTDRSLPIHHLIEQTLNPIEVLTD